MTACVLFGVTRQIIGAERPTRDVEGHVLESDSLHVGRTCFCSHTLGHVDFHRRMTFLFPRVSLAVQFPTASHV